jgi:hypothetical protein
MYYEVLLMLQNTKIIWWTTSRCAGKFKTLKITNVKHNRFTKSEGYMFRPQTVIIGPYNNLSQLVLYTYWHPIMFSLKCIKKYQNDLSKVWLRMCWRKLKSLIKMVTGVVIYSSRITSKHVVFTLNKTAVLDFCYFNCFKFPSTSWCRPSNL